MYIILYYDASNMQLGSVLFSTLSYHFYVFYICFKNTFVAANTMVMTCVLRFCFSTTEYFMLGNCKRVCIWVRVWGTYILYKRLLGSISSLERKNLKRIHALLCAICHVVNSVVLHTHTVIIAHLYNGIITCIKYNTNITF